MGKPRSSKTAETDFDAYVERRISELGLATTITEIQTAATKFESLISFLHHQANVLIVLSAICLGFILYLVVGTPDPSVFDVVVITLSGAVGFICAFAGMQRKEWKYCLDWWVLPRRVRCREQRNIDAVLHDVNTGNHSIMRLATSGMAPFASPVSTRPVDLILSQNVLSDPWIAAFLFGTMNASCRFIAVTPEPTGDWFKFYLWHPPVAQELLHLFDGTPEIYPDDLVKRLKVRIALQVIIDIVSRNAEAPSKESLAESKVVKKFENTLKIEAARLLRAGEINDLEERQLCRVNISGEAPSVDPAEEGKKHDKKPHSWFLELKGGRYSAVVGPLSTTVQAELNLSPGFVA